MRMSRMLIKTQKQIAAEAELPSHQLILRAGLARRLGSGIYSLTPLAYRVIRRIETILREEMERIGGQEVLMPVAQPADLWRESGRYETIDSALARWQDRAGHAMVLAMTHEEAVTDLARSAIDSYRQLPQLLFQIQTKFRDEPRPRGGLIRLREFLMKDAYSFHATQADFDAFYEERIIPAYYAIFRRAGLPVLAVEADTGMMGGTGAHEFMFLADGGEDTLIVCPNCGYAANQEVAIAVKPRSQRRSKREASRLLHTPGTATIAAFCEATGYTADQTLKSVYYAACDELVLALIRGDLEVSPIKLGNLVGREVRVLSSAEATERGLVVGYTGPVDLHIAGAVRLVADDSVIEAGGLVSGANRLDYHRSGVMYGRDYQVDITGDIAQAQPGDTCVQCGGALEARRGIEAGQTFKLGTRYSETMGATFRDEDGESRPLIMGCYGIGITRLFACLIEAHHDEQGICWPVSVAPYRYHLLAVGNDANAQTAAGDLYAALGAEQTLYDDREASAGVRFADADLLGMPLRITISTRSLAAGGAELRLRRIGETRIAALDAVRTVADEMLACQE